MTQCRYCPARYVTAWELAEHERECSGKIRRNVKPEADQPWPRVGPNHHHLEAATPPAVLRAQIMDSRIPKSEREWWAAREIEYLYGQISCIRDIVCEHSQSEETRLNDIYDLAMEAIERTLRLTQPTDGIATE